MFIFQRRFPSILLLTLTYSSHTIVTNLFVESANVTNSSIDDNDESLIVDCSNWRDNPIELSPNKQLLLHAIIDPIHQTFMAELIRMGQGWIALGFYSDQIQMMGSQAVIGKPDEPTLSASNPAKYDLYEYGIRIMDSQQQTLTQASIVQNSTVTVLTFTKPLVEFNQDPISATEQSNFLWAMGSSNALGHHAQRGGIAIQIPQCRVITQDGVVLNQDFTTLSNNQNTRSSDSSPSNYHTLWIVHGALAATAWAILIPLGIGASLLRNLFPFLITTNTFGAVPCTNQLPWWFLLHQGLNGLAAILTIVSFSIAVSILSKTQSNALHFTNLPHHTMGLVIFLFTLFQALNGMLRPHLNQSHALPDNNFQKENIYFTDEEIHEDVEGSSSQAKRVGSKSLHRILWEITHRILGVSLLGMAWWQVQNGLGLFLMRFPDSQNMIPVFWGVALGLAGTVLVLYLVQMFLMNTKKI